MALQDITYHQANRAFCLRPSRKMIESSVCKYDLTIVVEYEDHPRNDIQQVPGQERILEKGGLMFQLFVRSERNVIDEIRSERGFN